MGPSLFVTNLSRIQFAMTAGVHFFFVTTSLGLMTTILIFELIYAFGGKKQEKYGRLALFFGKIYFYSFATGVVTGLIMEMQFGLNWSSFSRFYGDVVGVPLVIEGTLAFFVESNLVGLWRFTWGKISKKWHALIAAVLLFSSMSSITFIIAFNAFLQNPYGFHMQGKHARLDSFISLFENPRYLPQFMHVFIAALIVGGFLTAGISAWQILHKRDAKLFQRALQIGLLVAVPVALIQQQMADDQLAVSGPVQPMKLAAAEGQYNNEGSKTTGTSWYAAAIFNEKGKVAHGVSIPGLGSYFSSGKFTGKSLGMKTVAKDYHAKFDKTVAKSYDGKMKYYPPVNIMFWAMRIMIYSGFFYAIFGVFALVMSMRKNKYIAEHPKTLKTLGITMWIPYLTVFSGWVVAEVGRYPFVVYGLFTQYDAVSPTLKASSVLISLIGFGLIDIALMTLMIVSSHRSILAGTPDINGNLPEQKVAKDPFDKEAFANA